MTAPTVRPVPDPAASQTEPGVLEHALCDLCGADQPVVLFQQRDLLLGREEPLFRIVRCAACGLMYLNPRPSPQTIGHHYPSAYYQLEHPPSEKVRGPLESWLRRVKARLRMGVLQEFYGYGAQRDDQHGWSPWTSLWRTLVYAEHLRLRLSGRTKTFLPFVGKGRLLDVGCGRGDLLGRMVALGWEGCGVEISPETARYAREQRGLKVVEGELCEARFPAGMFDMVIFHHSLEHVFSPTATLREANRILQRCGRLFLVLPNAASAEARLFGRWWFAWDVPRHLYHFTPQTLERCLRQTGFRVMRMAWDRGTKPFLESLSRVWKFTWGRPLPKAKPIVWMVRPLIFCFRHLRLGPIMIVHAEKVAEVSTRQGQHCSGAAG